MSNSTAETKLAIARLTGRDLPLFVPRIVAGNIAKLVRSCIVQSGKTRSVTLSLNIYKLLSSNLKKHSSPEYTISQYLLLVLRSVNTTEALIKKHNSGKMSDSEFIQAIKGVDHANKTKSASEMGGSKVAINASDRAVNADEIYEGA